MYIKYLKTKHGHELEVKIMIVTVTIVFILLTVTGFIHNIFIPFKIEIKRELHLALSDVTIGEPGSVVDSLKDCKSRSPGF